MYILAINNKFAGLNKRMCVC